MHVNIRDINDIITPTDMYDVDDVSVLQSDPGKTGDMCLQPDFRSSDAELYDANMNALVNDSDLDSNTVLCAGCGSRIMDRYFLSVAGQQWHVTCLRCSACHVQLDSQVTCFVRDGHVFCKQDYHSRFSMRRCARCHVGLSSLELVMRSRDLFYHVDCFTCFACNKPLSPGDTYGIHEDQIFCHEDYEDLLNNSQIDTSYCHVYDYSYPDVDTCTSHEYLDYCAGDPGSVYCGKGRSRKRRHNVISGDTCFSSIGGLFSNKHGDLIPRDKYSGHPPRQKRVRTSFKHTQLRTMKSYFAMNHNPDAKDLKDLAKKTQLSKRVLQVWFQNARAKYRRNASKQVSDNAEQETATAEQSSNNDTEQLLDLSKCRSPALSDVSNTNQSLTSLDLAESQSKFSDSVQDFSDENGSS